MTSIDLSTLSPKQLDSLASKAQTEMASRERTRRSHLRHSIEAEVHSQGYVLSDLFPALADAAPPTRRSTRPPRFRDPHSPEHVWTGIGRAPNWIRSILDERGITLPEFKSLPMYLIDA